MVTTFLAKKKPVDDLAAARERADALRREAAKARQRFEAAEADLDDMLVRRALGEHIADEAIRRLESARDKAQREVAEAERVLSVLDGKLREMDDQARTKLYQEHLAELASIGEQAAQLERDCLEAAARYAETAQRLAKLQARYDELSHAVSTYEQYHPGPHPRKRVRRPYRAPQVPASVLAGRTPVASWLAEWRETHPAE